jgi:hypothetical protein
MEREYIPPLIEIFEYEVERGYAMSKDPSNLTFDVSDSLEDVHEGKHYDIFGEDNWY